MIGYLTGKLFKKEDEKILLLVNNIGYEVLIPGFIKKRLEEKELGDELELYIYYQQTERQLKPLLIGFDSEEEKDFFQHFLSVEDIGPSKAIKAMNISVHEIAYAIETKNSEELKRLKGIGERTAQKIIATLSGKMKKFLLTTVLEPKIKSIKKDLRQPVLDVLLNRLGYKFLEANKMIEDALTHNSRILTPEELFDEIYKLLT